MKSNISYINSANHFAKGLFLKDKIKKSFVLIVEEEKDIKKYEEIFSFLKINFKTVDNYAILNELKQENFSPHLASPKGEESLVYLLSTGNLEKISEKKNKIDYFSLNFKVGKTYDFEEITKQLLKLNYSFSEYKNPGTYSKKGDLLTIISIDSKTEYKISFWGNEVDSIFMNNSKVDFINIGINRNISSTEGFNPLNNLDKEKNIENFFEIIDNEILIVLDNLDFYRFYKIILKQNNNFSSFDYIGNNDFKIVDLKREVLKIHNLVDFKNLLTEKKDFTKEFYTKNYNTIKNFVELNDIKKVKIKEINNPHCLSDISPLILKEKNKVNFKYLNSFIDNKNKKLVFGDNILEKIFTKKRIKRKISRDLDLLLKIKTGDYVVHIDHGVGKFIGIIKRENPVIKEYLEIHYAKEDKLFVPIEEVSRVNKYIGENPKLTPLSGKIWEKQLQKAKKEVETIVEELIEIYAKRKIEKGFAFKESPTKEQNFSDNFGFEYTIDQKKAITETLEDMTLEKPMDRLIVGDVGFGKTEIAFNAIFRAFLNKKQSILIVPLVVLAYEHFEKAKNRFTKFGLKIEILTRLESEKKEQEVIRKLTSGGIDLIIGTHKLLSDKIKFKDLGLLVIDEEHKFGVKDKEKIKEFKENIDTLAMSATPIPRSLNMALSDIRQLSLLKTPIFGRQDISTIIDRYSENTILDAGKIEFERGGQIFFVHNRVSSIENIKTLLQKIFKNKKIVIAHGQMSGIELEKRIIDFKNKKYDILLSTTVIENGIDFPNVNTIIINNAPNFGLSQIHQLRGRVGRSSKKGYCYLLYKNENLKEDTAKRLKMLAKYSYLGAGFELAMKDLEIRGAGDLLGFRQSGSSNTIGINLYLKLIEEKLEELQGKPPSNSPFTGGEQEQKINPKIDLNLDIFIDDKFFNSELDKINFYREIELIEDLEELENIKKEFVEKMSTEGFNPLNNQEKQEKNNISNGIKNLFNILKLRLKIKEFFIINIRKNGINYEIKFYDFKDKNKNLNKIKKFLDLDKQIKFVIKDFNTLRSQAKNYKNKEDFLEYLMKMIEKKNFKIKLKK